MSTRRALAALALLTACSGRPTPQQAEQERQRLSSQIATAEMIADAWDAGAAPGPYASDAIGDISDKLLEARSARAWSALPPAARDTLVRELGTLHGVTAGIDSAISRHDRTVARSLRQSLTDHGRALTAVPIDTARR